jgi:general secretion pathway protein K
MLELALGTCGVAGPRRGELVAAIMDWRDPDSDPGAGGMEDEGYRAAGLPWSVRDGAFESVEELRYVIGMDPDLYGCLAPMITVRSGRPNVEVAYAPPPLREAMAESGFAYAGRRRSAGPGTYQFVATAEGGRGAVASIEAVIRLSRDDRNPYRVLEWREPARGGAPPLEADR